MILSGMNAAEVGEIIGAYRDAGKAAGAAEWGCHAMMHLNVASTHVLRKACHLTIAASCKSTSNTAHYEQ